MYIHAHLCIHFVFLFFAEKDTLDVWVNGEKVETAVSTFKHHIFNFLSNIYDKYNFINAFHQEYLSAI